ncbi:unnamed protein product [Ambrosiozyma monospora]|uniref:Unnamed protein product n=1 Tax=Ambrosiozyma monospora TaxID=43982 RepID=A0ACB5U5B0_AMBMO|nr:unnamed protein product [Ambrosiozyma monospora]
MPRPKSQIDCNYKDFTIFMDVLKLVHVFLNHNQSYSTYDKEKMAEFMKSFLIKFFFMDSDFIEAELKKRKVTEEETTETKESDEESTPSAPTLSQSKKRPREYDLLKDVLRKTKRSKRVASDIEEEAPASSDAPKEDPIPEEVERAQANWISKEGPNILIPSIQDFWKAKFLVQV